MLWVLFVGVFSGSAIPASGVEPERETSPLSTARPSRLSRRAPARLRAPALSTGRAERGGFEAAPPLRDGGTGRGLSGGEPLSSSPLRAG